MLEYKVHSKKNEFMRKIYLPVILALGLISCGGDKNDKSTTENISTTISEEVKSPESIKESYSIEKLNKMLLDKHWGANSYFSKIEETKSIYANQHIDTKHQLLGIYFHDNINQLNGYGTHEGGYDSKLKFVDGELKSTESFLDAHFTLETENDQLILNYNDNTHDAFRKITNVHAELAKILLNGAYQDEKTGTEINFKASDGTVKGIDGKNNYEFVYDFAEGFEFDAVLISEDDGQSRFQKGNIYHYEAKNDKINLYRVNGEFPDDMPYTWDKENPTYRLVAK